MGTEVRQWPGTLSKPRAFYGHVTILRQVGLKNVVTRLGDGLVEMVGLPQFTLPLTLPMPQQDSTQESCSSLSKNLVSC